MATYRELQEKIQQFVLSRPDAVAPASALLWRSLAGELAGIIGDHGFQVLYRRCLHKAQIEFPWLPEGADPVFSSLQDSLAQQAPALAAAATVALLSVFCSTLIELIGESLTSKILQSAWDVTSQAAAVKGTPQ